MFAASQRCVSSEPQLKTSVLGHARGAARSARIAVGVLRVVTLEQIAVGDVVEKKFAHVRTDERAIAVRAHERDAREHRTVASVAERADGSKSTVDEMSIASASAGTAARVSRTFAAREAIHQVSGRVQEVPGLGTRVRFEKREGRARRDGRRALAVLRAEVRRHDAVQLALHAAPLAVLPSRGERMRVMVRVVRVRGAVAGEVHVRHPGRAREGGPGRGAGERPSAGDGDGVGARTVRAAAGTSSGGFSSSASSGGRSADALRFDRRVAAGLGVGAGRDSRFADLERLRSDSPRALSLPFSSLRVDALSLDCSSPSVNAPAVALLEPPPKSPAAPDPGRRGSDSLRVNPGVEGCADPSPETRPEAASAGRDRDDTNALAGAGDADAPMPPRAPARASAASAAAAPWRPAATRCSWMSCTSSSCGYRIFVAAAMACRSSRRSGAVAASLAAAAVLPRAAPPAVTAISSTAAR